MNGLQVLRLLVQSKTDLNMTFQNKNLPIAVSLSDDLDIGFGTTGLNDDNDMITSYVGIHGLSDEDIPDGKAMLPIVALFHESCGHGMQQAYEFKKTTVLSKVIAASHYACSGSGQYYGDGDISNSNRYFKHPHEIAAQYMGVKCAHQWLISEKGKSEADRLMKAYATYRRDTGCSMLPDGHAIRSVKDILTGLNKSFRMSVHAKREYAPQADDMDAINLFVICNKGKPAGNIAFSSITNCNDGLLQDVRMTWFTVWANSDQGSKFYKNVIDVPVIRAMDMNPFDMGTRFRSDAKPFHTVPESVSMALQWLKSAVDYVDRQDDNNDRQLDEP